MVVIMVVWLWFMCFGCSHVVKHVVVVVMLLKVMLKAMMVVLTTRKVRAL